MSRKKITTEGLSSNLPVAVALTPRDVAPTHNGDGLYETICNELKTNYASEGSIMQERVALCAAVIGWHHKWDRNDKGEVASTSTQIAEKLAANTGIKVESFQSYLSTANLGLRMDGRGKAAVARHPALREAILAVDLPKIREVIKGIGRTYKDIREVLTQSSVASAPKGADDAVQAAVKERAKKIKKAEEQAAQALVTLEEETPNDLFDRIAAMLAAQNLLESFVAHATRVIQKAKTKKEPKH